MSETGIETITTGEELDDVLFRKHVLLGEPMPRSLSWHDLIVEKAFAWAGARRLFMQMPNANSDAGRVALARLADAETELMSALSYDP